MTRAFVADASVVVGWVHPAQATTRTAAMLDALADGARTHILTHVRSRRCAWGSAWVQVTCGPTPVHVASFLRNTSDVPRNVLTRRS